MSPSFGQDVQYSMVLDVLDLCTPDLQKRLMPMREKIKKAEDVKLDRERAKVQRVKVCLSISAKRIVFRNSERRWWNRRISLNCPHPFPKVIHRSKTIDLFILLRYRFEQLWVLSTECRVDPQGSFEFQWTLRRLGSSQSK